MPEEIDICLECDGAVPIIDCPHRTYSGPPLPSALMKALDDPFTYALQHRTLGLIEFFAASIGGGGWIHLDGDNLTIHGYKRWESNALHGLPFERGIDIRLSDIIWVCDQGH